MRFLRCHPSDLPGRIGKIFLGFLVGSFLAACASASPPAPEPVALQLNWRHYAPFAGFYAAEEEGLYLQHGLAVELRESGPTHDDVAPLVAQEVEFGVLSADVLMSAQSRGEPLVAVAAILQHSPMIIVAPTDARINKPADLAARKVRVTAQIEPILLALLDRNGVEAESVERINLPSTVAAFASGQADAWGVYRNSFAMTLEKEGFELARISPDDYGVHFFGEMLVVHKDTMARRPELVARFVQATLGGYQLAIENSNQVGGWVTRYHPTADEELEAQKWSATLPLLLPVRHPLGWIDGARWDLMAAEMVDHSDFVSEFNSLDSYTNQFVDGMTAESGGEG